MQLVLIVLAGLLVIGVVSAVLSAVKWLLIVALVVLVVGLFLRGSRPRSGGQG